MGTAMGEETFSCPMSREAVVDTYFIEHRAKLIDLAAFLDRVDRARSEKDGEDFRLTAMKRAIAVLLDNQPHRARRILDIFSDHTTELPQTAAGMKGAAGAARV